MFECTLGVPNSPYPFFIPIHRGPRFTSAPTVNQKQKQTQKRSQIKAESSTRKENNSNLLKLMILQVPSIIFVKIGFAYFK